MNGSLVWMPSHVTGILENNEISVVVFVPRKPTRGVGQVRSWWKVRWITKNFVLQEHAVNDTEEYLEEHEDDEEQHHSEYDSHLAADQEEDNETGPQVYFGGR